MFDIDRDMISTYLYFWNISWYIFLECICSDNDISVCIEDVKSDAFAYLLDGIMSVAHRPSHFLELISRILCYDIPCIESEFGWRNNIGYDVGTQ